MCGLVGAIKADGSFWTNIQKFLWQGMYMNALRGMGGCGIGMVFKDYTTEYTKTHNSAPSFLYSDEWDWVEKNLSDTRAVLGHTRSATVGKVSTANSHPFRFKDANNEVLMIHNGHVRNHLSLTPASFRHDVDSAHVAYSLFSKGALPTLELLDGAYTLIWFDKKNSCMHLARNEERSLYYVQDKDKEKLYFSSELDMLSSLVRRNAIPHINSFHELETETLYTFDLREKKLVPTKTKYEQKKYQPAYQSKNENGYGGQSNWASFKNYTKPTPYVGDYIWCTCADPDDTALVLYKPIGEGADQVAATHAYGYVYGTRSMEYGSIVRVNGIGYNEWKDELHLIKSLIPVRITRVERGLKNKDTGVETVLYEGTVDRDESVKDIRQVKIAQKRAQINKEQQQRYEADLAAGRILPAGSPLKQLPAPSNDAGAGGNGVVVGPPNGSANEGLGLDNAEEYPPITPVYVAGPKGKMILVREWKDIALLGCFFCQGKFDIQVDAGKVEWWEHPRNPEDRKDDDAEWQMICTACQDDPHKMEAIAAA